MNYLLLFAIFLWLWLCVVCIKICYRVIRYRDTGTSKQWALVIALAVGSLIALKYAAESIVNK